MALLLNPRVWIAIAIVGFLSFTHFSAYRAGKANVRADFDQYKLVQAEERAKLEKQYRDKEIDWQSQAAQTEEAKNAQIADINSRLASALDSLSKRPSRPAAGDVSKASGTCKGGTGASLSAEDGQFLARESARADKLRSALEACYKAYDSLSR